MKLKFAAVPEKISTCAVKYIKGFVGKVRFAPSVATRHLPRRAGEAESPAFPVELSRFLCRQSREALPAARGGWRIAPGGVLSSL